ncbi:hypothetical protein AB0V79_27585 [Mesorhizobium ciceri]|uniref:hypothetical protein n=1 Tax=Mesorhizobium TaxID=68287 RepID=UPI0011AB814F|nr:hypothetical protein [Mesorhizobium ciceri]
MQASSGFEYSIIVETENTLLARMPTLQSGSPGQFLDMSHGDCRLDPRADSFKQHSTLLHAGDEKPDSNKAFSENRKR